MDEIKTDVVTDKYEDASDAYSDLQGTILWPRRSYLYRIGFLSLVPTFILFLLGFSCPFWMKKHQVDKYRGYYNKVDKVDVSIGLWKVCEGLDFSDITDCTTLPNVTSYEMACQAMLCLCLIFTFFSLTFGFYENFATRYDMDDGEDPRTRRPEVNAILSGIFGMIGVSLYGALIIGVAKDGEGGVHWAFPVTASAVTGVTICGILMAVSNPIHNSAALGYPGHVIGLSSQDSTHGREISMQDRLVSSNGLASPLSINGTPGNAIHGLSSEEANATEMTLLQRSESFISSHMSSPDLYTPTSERNEDYNQQTHVVETYDLYTRPSDPIRRQALRRQLEAKAAQRRSWHFDDRSGAYIVSDLINSRPEASSNVNRIGPNAKEIIKPPVPPRRDKMPSSAIGHPVIKVGKLQAIADEPDLMVLEDPVVTAPDISNKRPPEKPSVPERKPSMNRNTNPFLDELTPDTHHQRAHTADEISQKSTGSESWDNQSWPDPPTESEILGESLPLGGDGEIVTDKVSTGANVPTSLSQSNAVPESMQYQPQNSGSLSRTTQLNKMSENPMTKPDVILIDHDSKIKPAPMKDQRKENLHKTQKTEMHVPIMKEYDNPLFNRPSLNNNQDTNPGKQLYDSTSFINPSPSPSQQHFTLNPVDSLRRHSSHFPQQTNEDELFQQPQRQLHNTSPDEGTQQQGSGKLRVPEVPKRTAQKVKPKVGEKPNLNARPRQIKREHNQRRTGQESVGMSSHSPSHVFSTSNPDLSPHSPSMNRHARGRSERGVYNSSKVTHPHHARSQPPSYNDATRQPPPYTNYSSFPHFGDSDL